MKRTVYDEHNWYGVQHGTYEVFKGTLRLKDYGTKIAFSPFTSVRLTV